MNNESLFGHIAQKFSSNQLENIATEALAYIINRTKTAKKAFFKFIGDVGIDFDDNLSIRTQGAEEDDAIPDLVCKDREGKAILIIESKFSAGLTDNQPNTYLKRFPESQKCLLLFIAPVYRFPTLWSELLGRVINGGHSLSQRPDINSEFYAANVNKNHVLGIVSWRALLSYLLRTLETETILDAASDVKQLIGLCEKHDREAILPLSSEELCSTHGRRIVHFNKLIHQVTDKLVAKEIGSTKNLKATGYENVFGRYIKIDSRDWFIHFNARYWSTFRETPLWLKINDKSWNAINNLPEDLQRLERKSPSGLFFDGGPIIPLFLPFGVEEEQMVDSLFNQIKAIVDLLEKSSNQKLEN